MTPEALWGAALAAWRLPDEIAEAIPTATPHAMVPRHRQRLTTDHTPTVSAALAALMPAGSVLDVGCGTGNAAMPLRRYTSALIGVDTNVAALRELERWARESDLPLRLVCGSWPQIAAEAGDVDVVISNHVLYDVGVLAPFIRAMDASAKRKVVIEITETHPEVTLNALWWRFHALRRPDGPTADDAIAVIDSLGLDAHTTRWVRPSLNRTPAERVPLARNALRLPPDRDAEIEEALRQMGDPPRRMVTIEWTPRRAAD